MYAREVGDCDTTADAVRWPRDVGAGTMVRVIDDDGTCADTVGQLDGGSTTPTVCVCNGSDAWVEPWP